MNKGIAVLALLFGVIPAGTHGQEMCIKGGYPAQISPLTCQSRFFALALGHLEPQLFPITDPDKLTKLEADIRDAITKIQPDPKKITHETWKKATEEHTSNNFTLSYRMSSRLRMPSSQSLPR